MSAPYLKKRNGVYYVLWTEPGGQGRRVSTRATSLEEAKTFFAAWLTQKPVVQSGPIPLALTVADLWAVYLKKHAEPNILNRASLLSTWKNLGRHFGARVPSELTQDIFDDYVAKRGRGEIGRPSKPHTCRRELSSLLAILSFSGVTPPKLKLPAEGAPRDRWLKIAEVQKLLDAAREMREGDRISRGERFLWIALETASRLTAIMELTWDRVDFEIGVIHYDVPGAKRTKKRRTSVPISSSLRPVLERAYAERISNYVMDQYGTDMWRTVQMIAHRAGLSATGADVTALRSATRTGISPHVLRHTAATHMARRGVPLYTIAGVLGNSVAMIEKVYAKHSPGALAEAVAQISGGVLAPTN